ncbi:MAG: hypothetical protein SOU05_01205 [Atopobium sp.]|uniref:hypothetical protein n=1 Tax=Atopobium sp. TaxID=1872650 RepID=UPI002A753432|nr:hypothetical protein [Atopobium sp.]MDY2788013.1 hypothetical protein [Atopobium sp.]
MRYLFLTVIKEPVDIAFLFWSIAVGIVLAAGLICCHTNQINQKGKFTLDEKTWYLLLAHPDIIV